MTSKVVSLVSIPQIDFFVSSMDISWHRIIVIVILIQIAGYRLVKSGASCEASGSAKITSLAECKSASQALGLGVRNIPGTVDIGDWDQGPSGCYYRNFWAKDADGDLWYNKNSRTKAPCSHWSNCVCKKTGKSYILLH